MFLSVDRVGEEFLSTDTIQSVTEPTLSNGGSAVFQDGLNFTHDRSGDKTNLFSSQFGEFFSY